MRFVLHIQSANEADIAMVLVQRVRKDSAAFGDARRLPFVGRDFSICFGYAVSQLVNTAQQCLVGGLRLHPSKVNCEPFLLLLEHGAGSFQICYVIGSS